MARPWGTAQAPAALGGGISGLAGRDTTPEAECFRVRCRCAAAAPIKGDARWRACLFSCSLPCKKVAGSGPLPATYLIR
ncbi:hypothetical protein NDU88_002433 [Pleurodeles waltl]|uniref:Uncharacterized protein n=1 Tax=Pleurodeles waltl TaxID=8319 RepID=A0AAV7WL83_PLEWA|nr:hypothetical protein NDU88_002433 [Pleurodeles waltl]